MSSEVSVASDGTTCSEVVTTSGAPVAGVPAGDAGEVPPELTYTPVPYIALLGLNATTNEIHINIWNSFTVNRQSDRHPLYFKLLSERHQFLPAKPKKSSYEWHIPKGILKTNWMTKHLFEIPAVAVLFVDLDWDDPQWNDKLIECVAKVEFLRNSLKNRDTRLVLVLLQKYLQIPGDDSLATERATHLCNSCNLSAKFLFVLPINDIQQLMGYILRLENAIYELSKTYYQHVCKLIRTHREQLNKTTHQFLFIRHQFKLAFFSEIRQDTAIALKHYKQAYANLMEVRVTLTNIFEIKTIGGFINYKVCKLSFLLNTPLDAISHFRKHIDIFKNKHEPSELGFEHFSWLSKQHSLFADLFDIAISNGLVPSSSQHPGFYYYEASLYAIQRKKLSIFLCKDPFIFNAPPETFNCVLNPSEPMIFFGQRSWRPALQTLEPLDMEKENLGIKALQYKEVTTVSHSVFIIALLSSAINQFNKFKCFRMKRYLMILIGEEYYLSRDYINAISFLNNVLPSYREDRWTILTENILSTALKAAFLLADLINFVKFGLEFISSSFNYPTEEKRLIQNSIQNIMSKQSPLKLKEFSEEEANYSLGLWEKVIENFEVNSVITVRMDSITSFIECKVKFDCKIINESRIVDLDIFLSLNSPDPIKCSKLSVLLSNQYYNQFCEKLFDNNELFLMPMELSTTHFTFNLLDQDINQLAILGVCLNLCSNNQKIFIILQWSFLDHKITLELPKDKSDDFRVGEKEDICKNLSYNDQTFNITNDFDKLNLVVPSRLENAELNVKLKIPDVCKARSPTPFTYIIYNQTDEDLLVELSIGSCDNFMFSGNKLIQVLIRAKQNVEQNYIFYPLVCGSLVLPKFQIVIYPDMPNSKQVDYLEDMLPNNLFVMPQDKGNF